MSKKRFKNIDDYISEFPQDIQDLLKKLRHVIKEAAPDAFETISYQMPTFKINGNLVHFALQKNHIGFYPTPSAIIESKEELSEYKTSKGAIQFTLDKPIPYDLVKRIVEFRVKEQKKMKKKF